MPREVNGPGGAEIISAILKYAGLSDMIRHVMYDAGGLVTTDPALAAKERLILTRQTTIVGRAADVFYLELDYSSGEGIPQLYIGVPAGRVGFRDRAGDTWMLDKVLRSAGIHVIDGTGKHTGMFQYGLPGICRVSPETMIGWTYECNAAQGTLKCGVRSALTDEVEVVSDPWSTNNSGSGTAQSRLRLRASGRLRADPWSMMTMGYSFGRSSNVAQIQIQYDGTLAVGDVVRVSGATDASFNGTFTLTQASSSTIQYASVGADVSNTFGQEIRVERMTQKTATRAVASNVATITTATRHGLCNQQLIDLTGMTDATYNGRYRITTTSATSFTFALTHANESATADTAGTITSLGVLELESALGVINLPGGESFASAPLTPTVLSADQNDYAPGRARTYRLTTSGGARALTGLVAGWNGEERFIHNANAVGGDNITLSHASGSSAAANRFSLPGGSTVTIAPQVTQRIWYDATDARWKV